MSLKTTKRELIQRYGEPQTRTISGQGFFAHSVEEDCSLMGGLRNRFDERLEWEKDNKYIVAYIADDKLVELFS